MYKALGAMVRHQNKILSLKDMDRYVDIWVWYKAECRMYHKREIIEIGKHMKKEWQANGK